MAASPEDRTLEDAFGNCDLSIVEDDALDKFLAVQSDKTSLCILTSGGSQVALEKRAVRTLENFSTGNRGARCVEAFLDLAQARRYSVILLTRKGATLPYARTFSVSSFADAEEFQPTERGALLENAEAATACSRLRQVLDEQRLFVAEYTTVQEYLFSLRHIARKCKNVQRRAMFCLAAAVSDFYIPASEMAEHKIQTSDGSLTLTLRPVPKCLGLLTSTWASHAFFVSFKVTFGLLLSSARGASQRLLTCFRPTGNLRSSACALYSWKQTLAS